ncbi:MAG: type II toxin-antitoxin system VapC family toxin [Candidatus Eremiobacteraeota bacterium]|nr:type II toxin-antitoxin system VapC family toxin [Candidatus Eremiobacteraeota bacterium]
MSYLLDTHTLLWMLLRSKELPRKIRSVLTDVNNELTVSAASTWEISIKLAIGKLQLPGAPAHYLPDRLERARIATMPILPAHTYGVASLPMHHTDPFDRLIIAQAQFEGFTVITHDKNFALYDVKVLAF